MSPFRCKVRALKQFLVERTSAACSCRQRFISREAFERKLSLDSIKRAACFIMAALSSFTSSAHVCNCSAPFGIVRCAKPSRKPLLCRAVSDETRHLANDQQAHRDHLSRRQAILSAAALVTLPTLSFPACAQSPGPPPGVFQGRYTLHMSHSLATPAVAPDMHHCRLQNSPGQARWLQISVSSVMDTSDSKCAGAMFNDSMCDQQ